MALLRLRFVGQKWHASCQFYHRQQVSVGISILHLIGFIFGMRSTKLLHSAYILTLGLVRLTFAFGNMTVGPWICLIATHVVEMGLWWGLALRPDFNTKGLSIIDLAKEAIQLKLPGGALTAVQLIGVPFLIVLFLALGPSTPNKSASKKD